MAAAPAPPACDSVGGTSDPDTAIPWAQTTLGYDQLVRSTQGRGVVVAVLDTGFTAGSAQLRQISVLPGINVAGEAAGYTADCGGSKEGAEDTRGHGTEIISLIAASSSGQSQFRGIAPEATILPVKVVSNAGVESAASLARGIDAAVKTPGVRVINISSTTTQASAALTRAVRSAARADIVIVAAAGNLASGEKQPGSPRYPAVLAGRAPACTNVISVGATRKADGLLADFSDSSSHTTVVAPGTDLRALATNGRPVTVNGTSFAAPLVAGTVALLRAAHPELSAVQICQQLERTATRPPAAVPDAGYGYGTVDPSLALGTPFVATDPGAAPKLAAFPYPGVAPAADRSRQHAALAVAALLIAVTVLASAVGYATRHTVRRRVPG